MKTIATKTKAPIAENVKKMLKSYGIKALRCRIYRNMLYLTVSESDKDLTKIVLEDYDIGHVLMKEAVPSTYNGRTSFDGLVCFV